MPPSSCVALARPGFVSNLARLEACINACGYKARLKFKTSGSKILPLDSRAICIDDDENHSTRLDLKLAMNRRAAAAAAVTKTRLAAKERR